jgi:hypothetical protein
MSKCFREYHGPAWVVGDVTLWYQSCLFNTRLVWTIDQYEIDLCAKYGVVQCRVYYTRKTIGAWYRAVMQEKITMCRCMH